MRDLVVLGAMCVLVPLALRSQFVAYLLWGWAGLIAIQTFMYGFMGSVPYVMVFALVGLLTYLVGNDPEKRKFEPNGQVLLMLVFGFHAFLAAVFAYDGVLRNWEICTNLLKTLLFCLLMPMLVTSRLRIHAVLVMLALSAGYHGLLEGLKFIASGGNHLSVGNQKLGDRNHFAVLVAMTIPILLYLYRYANNVLARWGYGGALLVNFLAVISTQSRAGLLTLGALAVWYALSSRRKVLSIFGILAVAIGMLAVAPDNWTNRMETIQSVGEDSSFMGRVMAWKRGSAIALESPIFGGGFHSVQSAAIFEQFRYKQGLLGFVDTNIQGYPAAAHSIYFEVLGDMGFVGLFLFLLLIGTVFTNWRAVSRLLKQRKDGGELDWARDLAHAIAGAMVAYAVGGASLSAAYFELPYLLITLAMVLRREVFETVLGKRAAAIPGEPVRPTSSGQPT